MKEKRCFVVMGYGVRNDLTTGKQINLDRVYKEIIKPVVTECGYHCIRGDEVLDSGLIDVSMYYAILESDLVVADISTLNPNAIYELGVRHGVRRFRTVIMMESKDKFMFDLNHIRTLTYTYHRTKSTFDREAIDVRERLKGIIEYIDANEQVDSPLYQFINDLHEPQREKDGDIKKNHGKTLYERIKEANYLRGRERYAEAYVLFESLAKDIPSDPYFIQQMALCTYKQELPTTIEALDKALNILAPISESIDPETNGLIGSIFKRRHEITNSPEDIDNAIQAYNKAYCIYGDYYTGENYAYCLLKKAYICTSDEEYNEYKSMSKHIYREIYERNKDFNEDEVNTEYEYWMLASLAISSLVIGKEELSNKYEEMFLSRANKMMKTTYYQQKEKLQFLLKK